MNDADREIVLHKRIRDLEAGRKLACDAWVVSNDRANAMESERDTARAEADALRAEVDKARGILTTIVDEFGGNGFDSLLLDAAKWLGVSLD